MYICYCFFPEFFTTDLVDPTYRTMTPWVKISTTR